MRHLDQLLCGQVAPSTFEEIDTEGRCHACNGKRRLVSEMCWDGRSFTLGKECASKLQCVAEFASCLRALIVSVAQGDQSDISENIDALLESLQEINDLQASLFKKKH